MTALPQTKIIIMVDRKRSEVLPLEITERRRFEIEKQSGRKHGLMRLGGGRVELSEEEPKVLNAIPKGYRFHR